MARKSLTFFVGLAVTITLRVIPITGQLRGAQPGGKPIQNRSKPQTEPANSKTDPATDLRGTEQSPAVVKVLPASKTDEETDQIKADRQQESFVKRATIALSVLTIMVGLGQLGMISLQARIAGRQNTIMESQSAIMTGQRDAASDQGQTLKQQAETLRKQHEAIIVQSAHMADGLRQAGEQIQIAKDAAIAAKQSATAAAATLATNQEIERAYIGITGTKVYSTHAPDGQGGQDREHPISVTVKLTIENFGHTPGDLLGGYWGWCIGAAPHTPDLTRGGHLSPAFLRQGDSVPFEFTLQEDEGKLLTVLNPERGAISLWLIAEIHYEDRFGGLHAGGYGRRLASGNQGLLFQFTPETGPFNYDRPMHPDNQRNYGKGQKPHDGDS